MPIYSEPDEVMVSDISVQIGDENISVTFGKPIPQKDAVARAFRILGTFVHADNSLDTLIKTPSGWIRMEDIKVGDKVTTSDEDLVNALTDIIQDSAQRGNDSPVDRGDAEGIAKEILQSKGFIKAIKNIKLV